MQVKFDYNQGLLLTPKKNYPLETYRQFLLRRWEALTAQFKTTNVISGGKLVEGYDWVSIFTTATDYGAPVQEFLLSQQAIEQI
jgi:hypothetical protein